MRIDLPFSDNWTTLSELYRNELAKDVPILAEPAIQVQIYAGCAHALIEVTQGLARLFAHKKTIAIAAREDDLVFAPIAKVFIEDGYEVKYLNTEEIANPGEWIESVLNTLLFVVYSTDDPITGRLAAVAPLDAALKEKRVFKVTLSHAAFRTGPITRPAGFEARILSLSNERSLMVAGERCRLSPPISRVLPWPLISNQTVAKDLAALSVHRDQIENFEKLLPDGFLPYFKPDADRVYDRAVFYHPEFDGSAVIDALARSTGLSPAIGGSDGSLEATSPCRWQNPRLTDWLLARGESEEIVRGLVLIAAEALEKVSSMQLSLVAKELRKLQNG